MFNIIGDFFKGVGNAFNSLTKGLGQLTSMFQGLTNLASLFTKLSNPLTAVSALGDVFNMLGGKDKSTQERGDSAPNPILKGLSSLKMFGF